MDQQILLLGGNERIYNKNNAIYQYIVSLPIKHLLVLPLASIKEFDRIMYQNFMALALRRLNASFSHEFFSYFDKQSIDMHLDMLDKADGIFFMGGGQSRLYSRLQGTQFLDLYKKRWQEGELKVIIGTSAGATAQGPMMPIGSKADLKNIKEGFGILKKYVIDIHFSQRSRQERLKTFIQRHPQFEGIGIDEDTGVVLNNKETILSVIGKGDAYLVRQGQELQSLSYLKK